MGARKKRAKGELKGSTSGMQTSGALHESEEKYRSLIANFLDVVYVVKPDGTITFVSPQVSHYGYQPEEVLSHNFIEFIAPDWREHVLRKFAESLAIGGSFPTEFKWQRNDGEVFWVEALGRTVYDDAKQPLYQVGVVRNINERKRVEMALRESEEKFRVLAETSPAAICLFKDDTMVYYNPSAVRLTGYAAEELSGLTLMDLLPPDDRGAFKGFCLLKNTDGSNQMRYEMKLLAKGGEERCCDISVGFIDYEGKQAVIITAFDITERKRAEEALKLAQFTLETSEDEVAWMDSEARIIYVNDAACKALGYTRDELLSLRVPDLDPNFPAENWPEFWRTAREKGHLVFESAHRSRDGHIYPVDITVDFIKSGDNEFISSFARDITKRKRAEEALRENEIFLSNVFRSIQDGISVLDKDLNIIRVNHAMEKWYGHSMPLVGKKCYEAYHGRSEPCESCPSLRTKENKTMQNEVVPLVGESGPVGWVELYTFPLLDAGGSVIGIIEQVRDVTERMRTEEELKVAMQQAELYLDLMGHDINNMHQIALGYLELAQGMQDDAGQRELLDKPIEVLQRSAGLIHNVRKLQRLREGVYQTQKVDVVKVVADVQREFGAVPGKTITLNLNGREHCYVRANELLPDVFTNLVSNAIRHTGNPAEIIIDIDRVVEDGKPCYRVIVEDDGPGIPDEAKGRIFNRMHGGSARGMGLGLYLVKSLVESYGGRVQAGDRVPGDHKKGARFVVVLPAVE